MDDEFFGFAKYAEFVFFFDDDPVVANSWSGNDCFLGFYFFLLLGLLTFLS